VTDRALRADADACFAAALAAVEPAALVRAHLARVDAVLALRARSGERLAAHAGPVLVVGAGKAALAMARAVATLAGGAMRGGVVVVPHGGAGPCPGGVTVVTGAHPVPDAAGETACARLLAAVERTDAHTLVVAVLSGGASALLVAPAEGITLADKQAVTRALLLGGADIRALNAVRKHCSRVKGGGIARAAVSTAGLWALVLSDVVGDDPATIASGPTVADPTTFADARAALVHARVPGEIPIAVRARLKRGAAGRIPETPKPGDPALANARTLVVGGNRDAVAGAVDAARGLGYETEVLPDPLAGDAAEMGRTLAARLRGARRDRPVAVVGGGETTVQVRPGGQGGRCQHLALAAALVLAGEPGLVLAAGTDGVDGPTDAAGAVVDGGTVARATAAGIDPSRALAASDSHRALDAAGDLLRTGPTGTNVADVVVALRRAC
jgi:glycerate 2-kinase